MEEFDFTEFRSKISGILPDDVELDVSAIERRITKELEQLENDPDLYQKQRKVRERLREIEHEALVKLGRNKNNQQAKQGIQCSLCSLFESEAKEMIRLSATYKFCGSCISLVKQVVEEHGG